MAVTLSYDTTLSRVRITVDGLGDATHATVERSTDEVTWTTVRGGDEAEVPSGGTLTVDDYEFAPGRANTYRVTPSVFEDFETTALAFSIGQGTSDAPWARSETAAYTGRWSLRSGTITHDQSTDAVITVPTGATTLDFTHKVSSESGWDFFRVLVDGVEIGTSSGLLDWTPVDTIDVSGAAELILRYDKDTSATVGDDAAWVDNLRFGGFTAQQGSITPQMVNAWIKNLARPFLNRKITVTDFSDIERPSRTGTFAVVGRSYPVAVSERHGSRRYTLTVTTETLDEYRDLDLVLSVGEPILLHVPPDCLFPGMYAVVGDVAVSREMPRSVRRYFELPLTEVAAPGPDVVGSTSTYQTVVDTYATYQAVLDAEATYQDLVERIGDASEVIVP